MLDGEVLATDICEAGIRFVGLPLLPPSRPACPFPILARQAELDPFPCDLGQAGKMSMFSFLATGIKKYYDIGETLGKGSFGKLST